MTSQTVAYLLQYEALVVGHLSWTQPNILMDQNFLSSLGGIKSGLESHILSLGAWSASSMTWSLAITRQHVKIPHHNHSNFQSSPQQIIIAISSSTKSVISPKRHSTFSIPIVTAPEKFPSIFATSRTLRSTTADNVHYDVRPYARWIIMSEMSEFYERTSRPKKPESSQACT